MLHDSALYKCTIDINIDNTSCHPKVSAILSEGSSSSSLIKKNRQTAVKHQKIEMSIGKRKR